MSIPVLVDATPPGDTPMPFAIGTVADPRWENAEKTAITCRVTFPNHPAGVTEPMPFTAYPNDAEAHGREIFYRCVQGDFGPIADWMPPSADELATRARSERDALLSGTQWLVDRHRDELDDGAATTLSADLFAALQAYRRALRGITGQPGFPASITWPVSPL